jgi:diguanylate cyclase (GGDEF)-like protein
MAHNVLYVDDEPQNLDAFCRVFYDVDWIDEIFTTTSPDEALKILETRDVHAIVTDQRMPIMTGTELLARVIARNPDPVRLILTAYTDVKEILEAINRGHVYYFITKPFEAEELKIVIRRALEHYETVQELRRKNRELANALSGLEQAHREQVRLYEMVITDEKTGVRNYHYFRIRLGEEFERARRYAHDLALVMIDIDDFKRVNDTHGHLVGDETLKEVAQLLVEGQRSIDVVARYGGEEFAIILPETGREQAGAIAERLRARMAEHTFLAAGEHPIKLSVSCGLAAYPSKGGSWPSPPPRPAEPDRGPPSAAAPAGGAQPSKEDLIARADKALYRAKRSGKNRVCDEP